MSSFPLAERMLTQLDAARLTRRARTEMSSELNDCLDLAVLVPPPDAPPDLITMNSLFMVKDRRSNGVQKLMLCYPEDAEPAKGHISVFSPAGASLLGLRVGDTSAWHSPQGQEHTAVVTEILFQPEASGDFTL